MSVTDHLTVDQLVPLADAASGKRRFLRIRSVILAVQGRIAPHIAATLDCSRRAVEGWVAHYNNDDAAASSDDRSCSGRPSILDAEGTERLRARLDAGPTAEEAICTLRGLEIRSSLDREFNVTDSLPGV